MKDNLIFPASIFIIGVAALFFIVVSGNAAVPDCQSGAGICSWLIKDDYSQVYRGLVVNTYQATDGLIVANGRTTLGSPTPGTNTLNVAGNANISGTLNGGNAAHGKQRFTSPGTFTVPAGVTKVWVSMSGGGGGAGGNGEGGFGGLGGGGQSIIAEQVSVLSGENIAIAIGSGGTGGISNTSCGGAGVPGTNGASSLFGTYVTALGGGGGGGGSTSGCGSYEGSNGPDGTNRGAIFGETGRSGQNGLGYGGGGGFNRTSNSTLPGFNGAPGFVLVEW